jgi:hypothetical protein
MKKIIFSILVTIFGTIAFADQGNGGANEFIKQGKEIAKWLKENAHSKIEADGKKILEDVELLEMSLVSSQPLLNFVNETAVENCSVDVTAKLGCTMTYSNGAIADVRIAGAAWSGMTSIQKCELTGEILLVPYVNQYRLQKAGFICKQIAEANQKINATVYYSPQGHKVMVTPAGVTMDGKFQPFYTQSGLFTSKSVRVEDGCVVLEVGHRGTFIIGTWYDYHETKFCPNSIVRRYRDIDTLFLVIPLTLKWGSQAIDHNDWESVDWAFSPHLN